MALANKTFQDLITFTRSTSGSYVGSDGNLVTSTPVTNYLTYSNQFDNAVWTKNNSVVQTNLLQYSEQFENAYWAALNVSTPTANSTIAPDGTLTAETVTSSNSASATTGIYRSLSYAAGHTLSIYAKANTSSIAWVSSNSGESYGVFNLSTGTVISSGNATASIVSVGNGWYRLIVANTTVASTYFITGGKDSYTSGHPWSTGTWTSGNSIYLWGAQLVQGSVPGDYRATTTASLPVLYPDYNGALRARVWIPTASGNSGTVRLLASISPATIGATYTVSVYVKSYGRRWVFLTAPDASSSLYNTWFDLQNGVVGTKGANVISATITAAGNGYYRITATSVATAITQYAFLSATDADNSTTVTAAGNGLYFADAQLAPGDSAGPYYETTNNGTYLPRFDYDPVTRVAKGLLIEESRANLLTYSNDFQTAWSKTNITVTANTVTAPDGTTTASTVTATTTGIFRYLYQAVTLTNATTYTFSVYLKYKTARYVWLLGETSADAFAVFDLLTGTVGSVSAGVTSRITSAGNGWYRCSATFTVTSVTGLQQIGFGLSDTDTVVSPPATAGIDTFVYGAQLEIGAFATSYIPTGISQVTRAGDLATVNTLSPWFNQAAGTIYSEFDAYGGTNLNRFYEFAGATSSNTINGFLGPSTVYMEWVTTGGAPQAQLNAAGSPTAVNKVGAAYKENDFAASLNGAAPVTDAAGTVPVVSALYLGNSVTGSQQLNGHLRRITYYPSRLTNAQLQSITT